MTPDDWAAVAARRVDWRVADLHDLRIRFASVMSRIADHRRAIVEGELLEKWQVAGPDAELWAVLDTEGFDG